MAFWNKKNMIDGVIKSSHSGYTNQTVNGLLNNLSMLQQRKRTLAYYHQIRLIDPLVDTIITKKVDLMGDLKVITEKDRDRALWDEFNNGFMTKSFDVKGFEKLNEGYNFHADARRDIALESGFSVRIAQFNDRGQYIGGYIPPSYMVNFLIDGVNLVPTYKAVLMAINGYYELSTEKGSDIFYIDPNSAEPGGRSIIDGMGQYVESKLRMMRSTDNVYDRFGDPIVILSLKKNPNSGIRGEGATAQKALEALLSGISSLMQRKRNGGSGDIGTEIPPDHELNHQVYGENASRMGLNLAADLGPFDEQIIAKGKIPPFLLAKNKSTTERMSSEQMKDLMSQGETYFNRYLPTAIRDTQLFALTRGFGNLVYGRDYKIEYLPFDLSDAKTNAEVEKLKWEGKQAEFDYVERLFGASGALTADTDFQAYIEHELSEVTKKGY